MVADEADHRARPPPHSHRSVAAAAGQVATIGTVGHRGHRAGVTAQHAGRRGAEVPDPYGTVVAAGGQVVWLPHSIRRSCSRSLKIATSPGPSMEGAATRAP